MKDNVIQLNSEMAVIIPFKLDTEEDAKLKNIKYDCIRQERKAYNRSVKGRVNRFAIDVCKKVGLL